MKAENENKQPSGTQTVSGENHPLHAYQLQTLVQELKQEECWEKTGRCAKTLYKVKEMRIVLNVMQQGNEIKPHQANGPISVQVLEGKLKFNTSDAAVVLEKGGMLTLQEYIQHSVEALEETAFLLTVSPVNS